MTDEDPELFLDGEPIDLEELEMILRFFAVDLVLAGHSEVQIEHGEHLTLQ